MRRENIVIVLILFLGLILRIVNLNQSFWLDEAAQVIESSRPFFDQFNIPADFHPPLYHLILHFWIIFGRSEVWIRLPSVFFSLGSIFILYKLGVLIKRKNEGLIASFFLAISPYHLWYSQEARPYMLFLFTSLTATYFLLARRWRFYTIFLILSFYSLYFAFFLFASHLVYFFFFEKKALKKILKYLIVCFLVFLPWLPSFFLQLKTGMGGVFTGWTSVVSVTSWKILPLTLAKFIWGRGSIENNLIYGLVVMPTFIIFLFSLFKVRKEKGVWTIILFFFLPLFISLFVSFFLPIVAPQRLIFLLPFFFLIISLGISQFSFFWGLLLTIVVFLTNLSGLLHYYTNPYAQKEKWREVVSYVEQKEDKEAIALFVFPEPFAPYLWYKRDKIEALGIAPKFILNDEDLKNLKSKITKKKKVYLFQYLSGLTDPAGKTQKFLLKEGFREDSIKDFPGVGFIYLFQREI